MVDFYRVTHYPKAAIIAAAKADGWYEGADDAGSGYDGFPLIEYAIEGEDFEDFKTYREARAFALKARNKGFWKSARIYEYDFDPKYPGQKSMAIERPTFQEFEAGETKPFRHNL